MNLAGMASTVRRRFGYSPEYVRALVRLEALTEHNRRVAASRQRMRSMAFMAQSGRRFVEQSNRAIASAFARAEGPDA